MSDVVRREPLPINERLTAADFVLEVHPDDGSIVVNVKGEPLVAVILHALWNGEDDYYAESNPALGIAALPDHGFIIATWDNDGEWDRIHYSNDNVPWLQKETPDAVV